MKYTEFLQLKQTLESQGTSLHKELGIEKINEAGETTKDTNQLDVEKGHIFTRWGRMKTTLNKQGKKLQDQISKKIISKYLPMMVKNEIELASSIKSSLEKDNSGNELKSVLKNKRNQVNAIQEKQLNIMNKAIEGFLSNSGSQLDKKIQSSKLSDKNKLDLKNYWLLLKSQIHMNALNSMRTIISQKVKEAIGDNNNAENFYKESDKSSILNSNIQAKKSEVDKNTQTVKSAESEMKGEKQAEVNPKVGDKFTYTNSKGVAYNLEITADNGDGTFKAKTPDNRITTLDAEKVKKLIPEKQESKSELTPQTGAPKADLSKKL